MSALAEAMDNVLDVLITVRVEMPCVDVRHGVVLIADGVVLDESRRVERLRLVEAVDNPLRGLGGVLALLGPVLVLKIGDEPPCLVEDDPIEYRRVTTVAL